MPKRILSLMLLTLPAFGQSAPPPKLFEVASIKEHVGPVHAMETFSTSGPRLVGEGVSVPGLIRYAYNLKNYQLSYKAAPDWVDEIHDEFTAKAEGGGAPTSAEFRQMLQLLLAERFKLKVHREMKEMPIYALVVAKNGLKMKPSEPDADPRGYVDGDGHSVRFTKLAATTNDLVDLLGNTTRTDRPVIDKTGLTGTYAIRLSFTPERRGGAEDPGPGEVTLFTALQEQLGLKLEAQKGMVEIVVLDHVEKPTEN